MPDDARQKAEDHYYAGLDLFSEGNHEGALAEYQKSLDADPSFTEAMHGMARVLQDLNRLEERPLCALVSRLELISGDSERPVYDRRSFQRREHVLEASKQRTIFRRYAVAAVLAGHDQSHRCAVPTCPSAHRQSSSGSFANTSRVPSLHARLSASKY